MISAWGLGKSMSVYVTRPHGTNKETYSYTMSAWMILLAMFLIWGNVIAWGCIGLYQAWRVIA